MTSHRTIRLSITKASLAFLVIFVLPVLSGANATDRAKSRLNDSIVAVPKTAVGTGPRVVRAELTDLERAASINVVVTLRMRSFGELEARIQRGETIPHAEMEAKYLPLAGDYQRTFSWLHGMGITPTLVDKNHTNVFATGSVSNLSKAFDVTFARVANADGEFTSAVTPPSVPVELADAVLGVIGLQPHILMHAAGHQEADGNEIGGNATPADVLTAYDAPTYNDGNGDPINGSGQTIAIVMASIPLGSDLSAYWQAIGSSQSLANFTVISVVGGPTSASQALNLSEVTLDVEWASGIAPGANLRLYAINSLSLTDMLSGFTQVLNDGIATVASYSASGLEIDNSAAALQSASQTCALFAASKITLLASSGDGGSNPDPVSVGNSYNSSNPLSVVYPASDPNVTGVGGTTTSFDLNWDATAETTWSNINTTATNLMATGGGTSWYFPRPSWQGGTGLPSGTMRCVPDVAAMAQTDAAVIPSFNGGFVVLNGQQTGYVGTSLSCPIWAGVVALTNQYRTSLAMANVGFLNRLIYGLIGTYAYFDTTTGSNGAYSAGTGSDLCTGAGSPDISQFIDQTTKEIFDVAAPTSPVSQGSSLTMSVTPQLSGATYQWLLNGVSIPGATSSMYKIASVGMGDGGDYTVEITYTRIGAVTYDLGTLTVTPSISATTRLINISTRAQVGTGGNILIPGFVVSGSGAETLLIRADGPSLTQFGVPGVLAQPSLSVFDSNQHLIASNTGWGTNANPTQISSVSAQVGAFAFQANSGDCALVINLSAGQYTVQVSGVNNTTGVALAEVYEVATTGTRLINISTRAQVGTGGNILIPGFVIAGSGTEQLLVRADGPSLLQFSVPGVLTAPTLHIFDNTATMIAMNTGWGTGSNPSQIAAVGSNVGAFALTLGSADSAQIVNLSAGSYTIQVSGVNNSTGVALAEVYEVP
jgi:kumamolisin